MDEYACYLPTTKNSSDRKNRNKNKTNGNNTSDDPIVSGVKLCPVISNTQVILRSCELTRSHHLTLAHIRLSMEVPNQDLCHIIDNWVGQLADNLEDHACMVVILGGRSGEGNGSCFFHLKRPPELPKQL